MFHTVDQLKSIFSLFLFRNPIYGIHHF